MCSYFQNQTGDRAHTYGAGTYHDDKVNEVTGPHWNTYRRCLHAPQSVSPSVSQSVSKTKNPCFLSTCDFSSERRPTKCRRFGGCFNEDRPRKETVAGLSGWRMGTLPSVSSASLPSSIRTIEYKAAHPSFGLSQQMYCRVFKRLDRLQHHSFPFCTFACGGASASSINLHRLVAIHPQARPVEEVPRSKSEKRPQARIKKEKQECNSYKRNLEFLLLYLPSFHPRSLIPGSELMALFEARRSRPETLRNSGL